MYLSWATLLLITLRTCCQGDKPLFCNGVFCMRFQVVIVMPISMIITALTIAIFDESQIKDGTAWKSAIFTSQNFWSSNSLGNGS
jgi:hypothetical protein